VPVHGSTVIPKSGILYFGSRFVGSPATGVHSGCGCCPLSLRNAPDADRSGVTEIRVAFPFRVQFGCNCGNTL
jgi:hypothetical protein